MPWDVAPGFVRFEYTSSWGLHVMIVPTRQWSAGGNFGEFEAWNGSSIDADNMIGNFANVLKAVMHTSATITRATIFSKQPGEAPLPEVAIDLNLAGTETSSSWRQATQHTMTIRDTAFKLVKVVVLDAPTADTYLKYSSLTGLPAWQGIFNQLSSSANAWSSRFGARPNTFVSLTKTLNEKLRRAYRLA